MVHEQAPQGNPRGSQGGANRLPKMERPDLKLNSNQQDFNFFKEEWRRFSDSSGATYTKVLRDQLLQCAETGLRKMLQGVERLKNVTLDNLLMEMEKTAVRSNLTC